MTIRLQVFGLKVENAADADAKVGAIGKHFWGNDVPLAADATVIPRYEATSGEIVGYTVDATIQMVQPPAPRIPTSSKRGPL